MERESLLRKRTSTSFIYGQEPTVSGVLTECAGGHAPGAYFPFLLFEDFYHEQTYFPIQETVSLLAPS